MSCTSGAPTYSAYWVGLGGGSEQSDALEQVGTQADCSASGKTSYYAWYELVPKAPVTLKLTIKPGDAISARTAVDGTNVTVTLTDSTSGQSVTKTLTMSDPDTSTAEWIAEAPSECQGSAAMECTPLPLADFGTVKFTNARATADGHTGGISNSSYWKAQAIALSPESDGFTGAGYGGYGAGGFGGGGYSAYGEAASDDTAGASPSSLSNKGQSFTVKYGATTTTTGSSGGSGATNPSTGSGDGYGYGSGYGYGGYGYGGGYGDAYGYGGYGDSYGYGADGYGDPYGDGYGYSESYGDGGYTISVYSDEAYGGGGYASVYGGGWSF